MQVEVFSTCVLFVSYINAVSAKQNQLIYKLNLCLS